MQFHGVFKIGRKENIRYNLFVSQTRLIVMTVVVFVLIAVMLPPHRHASTRQKKQLRTIKQLPQVNEPFLNAPSGRQGYSGFIVRYSDEIKFTLL